MNLPEWKFCPELGFFIFFPDTVFQLSGGGGLRFFGVCLQNKQKYLLVTQLERQTTQQSETLTTLLGDLSNSQNHEVVHHHPNSSTRGSWISSSCHCRYCTPHTHTHTHTIKKQNKAKGLKRYPSVLEHWLPFQRIRVQSLAPKWWLTTIWN